MSDQHPQPAHAGFVRLAGWQCLRVSGIDARQFLQGQLTADMDQLSAGNVLLASCNSAQGRAQAVLWLFAREDAVWMLLPATIAESTAARLRKYVLRAKVKIDPSPAELKLAALDPSTMTGPAPGESEHLVQEGTSYLRLPRVPTVLALTSGEPADPDASTEARWRAQLIHAGLPTIHPQTHEHFVPQMLNLDLLGGISFEKGCYTGQEIVARAHFRGSVKRRMFAFRSSDSPPAPGARLLAGDQAAGEVVDAVASDSGCELLAVVSLAQLDQPLRIEGASQGTLERMPLPYDVPT